MPRWFEYMVYKTQYGYCQASLSGLSIWMANWFVCIRINWLHAGWAVRRVLAFHLTVFLSFAMIAAMDLCSFVSSRSSYGTPFHRWFSDSSVAGKLHFPFSTSYWPLHTYLYEFFLYLFNTTVWSLFFFSLFVEGVLGSFLGFMDFGILKGYRRHFGVSVEWRMPLRCVLAEGSTELAWLAKARLHLLVFVSWTTNHLPLPQDVCI